MEFWNKNKNMDNIRIVKTARDKKSINEAASKGLQPLLKKVVPSSEIRSKYAVIQNKMTGEITVTNDYRIFHNLKENPDLETVIDWTEYYPHNFASPFAAYLIPKNIQIGERVFIEDLIEDYVGVTWNQGDTFRLESCDAIWNGKDLEIQYNPQIDFSKFVG
jgi:hypothetical protein